MVFYKQEICSSEFRRPSTENIILYKFCNIFGETIKQVDVFSYRVSTGHKAEKWRYTCFHTYGLQMVLLIVYIIW